MFNFIKWNFDIILLTFRPNIMQRVLECWLIAENIRFLALMREMNLSAHRLSGKTSLLNGVQTCSCKYYKFVIMSKIRLWMRQLASCMICHILDSVNTQRIDMIAADIDVSHIGLSYCYTVIIIQYIKISPTLKWVNPNLTCYLSLVVYIRCQLLDCRHDTLTSCKQV